MLKKLRLKFICITMAIVTIMLCVIFGLVYGSTSQSLARASVTMLQQLAEDPSAQCQLASSFLRCPSPISPCSTRPGGRSRPSAAIMI